MTRFAQTPIHSNPDSWVNLDRIAHVRPNDDGTTEIFLLGGARITSEESPDTVMQQHFMAESKFVKLPMVTRWTGELETKDGWVNISAVTFLQDNSAFTDIHMQDGTFIASPDSANDLVCRFNAALYPKRDTGLDCADCEAHNGTMHEYWCKRAGTLVNNS